MKSEKKQSRIFLNAIDTAERLGISEKDLTILIKRKKIPFLIKKKRVVFDSAQLTNWISRLKSHFHFGLSVDLLILKVFFQIRLKDIQWPDDLDPLKGKYLTDENLKKLFAHQLKRMDEAKPPEMWLDKDEALIEAIIEIIWEFLTKHPQLVGPSGLSLVDWLKKNIEKKSDKELEELLGGCKKALDEIPDSLERLIELAKLKTNKEKKEYLFKILLRCMHVIKSLKDILEKGGPKSEIALWEKRLKELEKEEEKDSLSELEQKELDKLKEFFEKWGKLFVI